MVVPVHPHARHQHAAEPVRDFRIKERRELGLDHWSCTGIGAKTSIAITCARRPS